MEKEQTCERERYTRTIASRRIWLYLDARKWKKVPTRALNLQLIDSCPQAHFRAWIGGSAGNYAEPNCNHYKEARLRWGVASFFTGAPQELCGSAALAHC